MHTNSVPSHSGEVNVGKYSICRYFINTIGWNLQYCFDLQHVFHFPDTNPPFYTKLTRPEMLSHFTKKKTIEVDRPGAGWQNHKTSDKEKCKLCRSLMSSGSSEKQVRGADVDSRVWPRHNSAAAHQIWASNTEQISIQHTRPWVREGKLWFWFTTCLNTSNTKHILFQRVGVPMWAVIWGQEDMMVRSVNWCICLWLWQHERHMSPQSPHFWSTVFFLTSHVWH